MSGRIKIVKLCLTERERERERERENVTVSKWHVQKVGILKFLKVADIHAVR